MSDEQQRHAQVGPAGWQPIPRGAEYDAEGTAFVQLPPELLAHPGAALSGTGGWDPLAATGAGGYTPPTGESWQQPHAPVQAQPQWSEQWGAQASYEPPRSDVPADGGTHGRGADPHATAEWAMPFATPSDTPSDAHEAQAAHPADRTAQGHWTVPAAGDDPVDESGEYVLHGRPGGQEARHADPHDPAAAYAVPQPPAAPGSHDSAAAQGAFATPHAAAAQGTVEPGSDAHGQPAAQGTDSPGQPAQQAAGTRGIDPQTQPDPQAVDAQSADPHGQATARSVAEQGVAPQDRSAPQAPAAPGVDVHGHGDPHLPAAPPTSAPHASGADDPAGAPGAYVLSGGTAPQGAELHGHLGPHGDGVPDAGPHTPEQWTPHGGSAHAWQQPAEAAPPGGAHDAPEAGPAGQWSIPVVSGEPADESGEYALSGLAEATPGPSDADSTSPSGSSSQDATEVTDTSDHQTGGWTPPAAAAGEEPTDGDDVTGAQPEPAAEDAQSAVEPPGPPHPAEPANPHTEHPCASYVLRVNGTDRPVTDAWIGESLLYVLRERLGLAGAKDGCSQGECGACSVQVDGRLVASCLVPAATAAGAEVRTVEGLAVDGRPSDVQRALAECGAVQCGFCVPGMAMTMHDLLEGNHAPSELETRQAICGNLCRCSGYRGVLDAVRQVAGERAATAAAQDEAQPETEQARIPHQAGPHGGGSGRASA
ncbi:2Fe-2S iron-sulfur cluster-binding protein [Streptomyces sp. NPDC051162]|uniref:2Fe-2S iron-sulfur cluster-binding protein n=1 Tax=Streptomyces sp. NPDC051162 TaxID=3154747 RepID=UPI00341329A2